MRSRGLMTAAMLAGALGSTMFSVSARAAAGGGSMPSMSAPSYDPAKEYQNGVTALQAGKFADAKRAFDRVLSAAPKDANANYLAGLARAGLGDDKGALKFFQKAVKYNDAMIPAHERLGVTFARLRETAKAQAEVDLLTARLTSCGDSCPEAADLRAALTTIRAAMGQGPQARVDPTPGLFFTDDATGDHAYQKGVSLINERRYQEAIQSLLLASFRFGPHPDVLSWLGFASRKLGRVELAETYYRKALAAAPGHKGATEYYGELLVERGDIAGARHLLAQLDASCAFGCAEAEELRRWIAAGHAPSP